MNGASSTSAHSTVVGTFNYLAAPVEPSLYRNGKVFTRRDRDGSDADWVGVDAVLPTLHSAFDAAEGRVNR